MADDIAIQFNNIGCMFFSSGQLDEAAELFAGALNAFYLKNQQHQSASQADDFLLVDPSVQRAFDIMSCIEGGADNGFVVDEGVARESMEDSDEEKEEEKKEDEDEEEMPQAPTGEFSPFLRMIPITIAGPPPPVQTSSSEDQRPCFDLVQAALLFNNALFYQKRWGKAATSAHRKRYYSSQRIMERSVTLYSMATGALFRQHVAFESVIANRTVAMFVLSMLNNYGYALYQVHDHEASRLSFGSLDRILRRLGPPLSEQERDLRYSFAANVVMFHNSVPTAAAA